MKKQVALLLILMLLGQVALQLQTQSLSENFSESVPYTMTNNFWESFQRSIVGWHNPFSDCLQNLPAWTSSMGIVYLSIISFGSNILSEGFDSLLLQDLLA